MCAQSYECIACSHAFNMEHAYFYVVMNFLICDFVPVFVSIFDENSVIFHYTLPLLRCIELLFIYFYFIY